MDTESLYQYHLRCSSFDCRMKLETAVITIIEASSIEEARGKKQPCEVCGSELGNGINGMIGGQLPIIQVR